MNATPRQYHRQLALPFPLPKILEPKKPVAPEHVFKELEGMTFDEWMVGYRPMYNPAPDCAEFQYQYEGETRTANGFTAVQVQGLLDSGAISECQVWTIVDGEDDPEHPNSRPEEDYFYCPWWLVAGFAWVNRITYLVTEVERMFPPETYAEIEVD